MASLIETETFLVSGTAIAVLTKEYLETVGVQPTVDSEGRILTNGLDEYRVVGMTIVRMAEVISNGFNMSILNLNDVPKIYQISLDFISENRRINNSGVYKVYSDELIDLIDNFVTELEKKHKNILTIAAPNSSFNTLKHLTPTIDFDTKRTVSPEYDKNDNQPVFTNRSSVGLY